jgi:outer membrane protein OmpA-like peptidoglycan-associated protein
VSGARDQRDQGIKGSKEQGKKGIILSIQSLRLFKVRKNQLLLCILVLLGLPNSGFSFGVEKDSTPINNQNLVPNGNFEKHSTFDLSVGPGSYIHTISDWKPAGSSTVESYSHRAFVRKFGQQKLKDHGYINFDTLNLRSGDGMVKLYYGENCPVQDTGCASYLKTKLTTPLELGEVYEVSMWVYSKEYPGTDTMVYSHIGMFLTRDEIFWKTENRIPTEYFFNSRIIPGQWTEIKWYIRALCSLKHLTIGVFKSELFPSLYRGYELYYSYYVDDVSIKKVNEDSLSGDIHPTPYCEYYEKENKQRTLNSVTALDLRFESNSSTLDASDQIALDSFYQANLERKDKIFVIVGHTDSETAENILLSQSRAESVSTYLHEKYNINKQSMLIFGLGSSYPIADNATSTGRLLNRRTTIRTSDLTIPQLFYRKGLEYIQADSLGKANIQFTRWIKMVPLAKRVEMLIDPRLLKLKRSIYWKPLVAEVRKGYSLYPDSKSAFFLDSLYFEDQRYRTYSPYALNGFIEEIDTVVLPVFKFTEQQYNQKDSLNFLAIQKYLDHNGYPKIAKVGRRQSKAVGYIILHHFDSLTFERYLPVIKSLCMEGEAEWNMFAMMTDKLCIKKGEPQVYGTQYDRDANGRTILYKIDDIEKVNYRRMRIGMGATTVPE